MELGQADGIQCRTVEVFESLGLEGELLRRAYYVLEVAFWSVDREGKPCSAGLKCDHYDTLVGTTILSYDLDLNYMISHD
jgi:hypothetical protein